MFRGGAVFETRHTVAGVCGMRQSYLRFRALLARGLIWVLSPVCEFEWSIMFKKDLDSSLEPYRARLATKIFPAREEDILTIVGCTRFHTHDVLMDRFRAGNTCLVAKKDGVMAAFNWVVINNTMDACYFVEPDEGDAYCMDARTFDPFRGQGLHTELLSRLLIHARKTGRRQAFTRASAANSSSWKSHVRLGWDEVGSMFMFRPKAFGKERRFGGPDRYPLRLDRRAKDNR